MRSMVKELFKRLGAAGCIIAAFMGILLVLQNVRVPDGAGTSESVLGYKDDVRAYLKKAYSKYSNVKVTDGKEKRLNSQNYSQSELNLYYENYGKGYPKITGTCWAVATTSVLKFEGVSPIYKTVFRETVLEAIKKGWALPSENKALRMGFTFDHQDNLLTNMLSKYGKSKKGNNDYYDIYDTLVEEVDAGRVVIFSIIGHCMVGCGYVPYTVTYEKKNIFGTNKSYKKKEYFVICNDGWDNSFDHPYSYFPESEIGTGALSRWDFGITKVRNK